MPTPLLLCLASLCLCEAWPPIGAGQAGCSAGLRAAGVVASVVAGLESSSTSPGLAEAGAGGSGKDPTSTIFWTLAAVVCRSREGWHQACAAPALWARPAGRPHGCPAVPTPGPGPQLGPTLPALRAAPLAWPLRSPRQQRVPPARLPGDGAVAVAAGRVRGAVGGGGRCAWFLSGGR